MNIRFAVVDDDTIMVNYIVSLVREWADEYGKYHELWNAQAQYYTQETA